MSEDANMEFGIVGLGRMGGGLAVAACRKGMHVVGQDTGGIATELAEAGVEGVEDLADLREKLAPPRAVFLYVPAGHAVDELLEALREVLDKGDLVVVARAVAVARDVVAAPLTPPATRSIDPGPPRSALVGAGRDATVPGAGGSGASQLNGAASAVNGGDGANGIVIVWEYLK